MAASLDPSSLPPGAIDMVLAAAGVSLGGDADGEGIPDRRATLNAIMDLAPEPLVEWLLIEVLGNVLRPSAHGRGGDDGMSSEPSTLDMGSIGALHQAFRSAPEPILDDLVGEHAGEYVGPFWLRAAGALVMRWADAQLVRQALRPRR